MSDSVNNRINEFMQSIPGNEKPALDEFIELPNDPAVMSEVLALNINTV
ncbi:MAG: hypothetical protein AAB373_00710 [Patescibacteria group bacterium]